MWYLNDGVYGEKVIVYAKSKNLKEFADYNTAVPFNNVPLQEEIPGSDAVFGHTVFLKDGVFIMYFIVRTGRFFCRSQKENLLPHWNGSTGCDHLILRG